LRGSVLDSLQAEFDCRLPTTYVRPLRWHNGGTPRFTGRPTPGPATWADEQVSVAAIMAIGRNKHYSLVGEAGHRLRLGGCEPPSISV
jgi:hypothetical protein